MIDPNWVYADFIDGNGADIALSVAVDAGGHADVTGYIGGSSAEEGFDVAVDASGSAYVVGDTGSTAATFQTLLGPDTTSNGSLDVFIVKIEGTSALIFKNGFE